MEKSHQKFTLWGTPGACIWIAAVAILAYSNSMHASFQFDDLSAIVNNPSIRQLSKAWDVRIFAGGGGTLNRWLGLYTFALNYHFHQLDVFGYHLVNLLIHIINGCLVYALVCMLVSSPVMVGQSLTNYKAFLALAAALFFTAHPIQTQAVTYIYQRFASLTALFYLAGICAYLRGRLLQRSALPWFVLAVVMIFAGMLTKENAFTAPLAIILIEWIFFDLRHSFSARSRRCVLAFFVVTGALLLVLPTIYRVDSMSVFAPNQSLANTHDIITPAMYFFTQMRVIMTYLRLLIFPVNQQLDYNYPVSYSFFEPAVLVGFVVLSILLWVAFRLRRRSPLVAFGYFWFLLTLSVEASFIPIRHVIFEHRLYLPSVGFFIILAVVLRGLSKNTKSFVVVMTALVLIYGTLTFQRNKVWANPVVFWQDAVKKNPNQSRPYDNLGAAYLQSGQLDLAMRNFQAALMLDPHNAETYNNIGLIYLYHNQLEDARRYLERAIALDSKKAMAYNNLGLIELKSARPAEAFAFFMKAAQAQPDLIMPQLNLATVYLQTGQIEQALATYNKILQIDAKEANALAALVQIYLEQGKIEEALATAKEILQSCRQSLLLTRTGSLLASRGKEQMAEQMFRKALQWDPASKVALVEWGKLLGNQEKFSDAIFLWEKAQALDQQDLVIPQLIAQAQALIQKKRH